MKHAEFIQQSAVIRFARSHGKRYPGVELLHSIPNGGNKTERQGARAKQEGLLAGVPDLFLPVARLGYHGLYLELKKKSGGRLSEIQKVRILELQANGYHVEVCLGAVQAINALKDYFE